MHKGYAFVQFTNPFDARNATHGEDGRTVLGQVLGKYQSMDNFLKSLHLFAICEHLATNSPNKFK